MESIQVGTVECNSCDFLLRITAPLCNLTARNLRLLGWQHGNKMHDGSETCSVSLVDQTVPNVKGLIQGLIA